MLLENAFSRIRINRLINHPHAKYNEDWTRGDGHYYTFIKAEKDVKI